MDLVLCSAWHEVRKILKIEVDLRTRSMPQTTIAGRREAAEPKRPQAGTNRRRLLAA
jgi:hypothetical protein